MGLSDVLLTVVDNSLTRVAWDNPVTRTAWSIIAAPITPKKEIIMAVPTSTWVRLAGLSGATAVILGAYGAHVILNNEKLPQSVKDAYETGNRYHMYHSLALLGASSTKYPAITGSLLAAGMVLFSGSCYYYGLTQCEKVKKVTPAGGTLLIAAWLSFLL